MAAHRWWRCSRIVTARPDAINVGELQFRSSGGSNLATGGTALASSYMPAAAWGGPSDLTPARAFDGANSLTADIWHMSMTSGLDLYAQWIGYQWASAVDVAQVAVAQRGDGVSGEYWQSCNIQASDDGVRWKLIGACAFPAPTSGTDKTFKVATITPLAGAPELLHSITVTGAPSGPVTARLPDLAHSARDVDGGTGVIAGSVAVLGPPVTPLSRRVLLISERMRRVVREQWSGADGLYRFEYLSMADTYSVVCHDSAGTYRALIAGGLVPEEM